MIWMLGLSLVSSLASAAPIPFAEAVRTMLGRDTEVKAVGAEAEAASASALGKRYHFLPTLSLDGTETWAKDRDKTTSVLGTARLSLFRFGADLLASSAANAHERSARARLERTRLDREKKAIDAYLELVRATESREVLSELEKMGEESVEVARRRFAGGRIAAQEVEKVKIDLADTRFQKSGAEQAWIDARSAVEALLGTADVVTEFPWKARIEKTHATSPDADTVLKLRPEWIEAEAESRSAEASAKSARSGLLPELAARVSYGWTKDPFYSTDFTKGWEGALTLSVPIFSGFRDYSGYRFEAETAHAAEARMEGIKRDVLAEVRAVPSRFEIARKTALERDAILKASKRLYQDNLSRFRQGRATSDELNTDLDRYLKIQLGAIKGWVAAHQAFVDLAHLRGVCATDCRSP
jgi:outer membrane protein TolC